MGIQLGKCQRWNRNLCTRAHISASAFGSSCMGLRLACWSWCLRKYCRKWILITLLCYRDGSTTSLLWKKEGDQGMNWKEAKVDLPADGGLQYTLVFASDMVTQDLRCVFFLLSSLFYCFLLFFFPATSPLMTLPWLRALVPMWEVFSIVLPHLDYFLDCSFFICFHLLKDLLDNLGVCIQLLDCSHTLCILPLDWVLPLETGPWCPSSVWVWNRRCLWLQNSKFNFNLFNILIFKKVLICQKKRQSLWKIKLKIFVVLFPYRRMCLVAKPATYLCECF